jgi:hypothetical protein
VIADQGPPAGGDNVDVRVDDADGAVVVEKVRRGVVAWRSRCRVIGMFGMRYDPPVKDIER